MLEDIHIGDLKLFFGLEVIYSVIKITEVCQIPGSHSGVDSHMFYWNSLWGKNLVCINPENARQDYRTLLAYSNGSV